MKRSGRRAFAFLFGGETREGTRTHAVEKRKGVEVFERKGPGRRGTSGQRRRGRKGAGNKRQMHVNNTYLYLSQKRAKLDIPSVV